MNAEPTLLTPTVAGLLIVGLVLLAAALVVTLLTQRRAAAALRDERDAVRTEVAGLRAASAGFDARLQERDSELQQARVQIDSLRDKLHAEQTAAAELRARVEEERKAFDEKAKLLEATREKLAEQFKLLSAEALDANKKSLLQLAEERFKQQQQAAQHDLDKRSKAVEELVKPLSETLGKLEQHNQKLESARSQAYGELSQQMRALLETHLPALRGETEKLVKALRQPHTRGQWGEVQLKRVAEMAGMTEHVDFAEQESASSEEGRLRPDMVVRLPGGRRIVVDAKAPVAAYLEAIEAADDEARAAALKKHAQQVRSHIQKLGEKRYFEQFSPTPEFVVLFVPGEVFFSEALKADPGLIEYGADRRVIIASPTTLIALLKAVSYGWRQHGLAENAEAVARLGKELYERIGKLAEHWQKVGRGLDSAVSAYNDAVGTLERRVLVSARRFRELEVSRDDLPQVDALDHSTRPLAAPEMQADQADDDAGAVLPDDRQD